TSSGSSTSATWSTVSRWPISPSRSPTRSSIAPIRCRRRRRSCAGITRSVRLSKSKSTRSSRSCCCGSARAWPWRPINGGRARASVLDLSVGSPLVSGDARENGHPALTDRIDRVLTERATPIGVGRYGEALLLDGRNVHLGLDLYARAGTPIHAPLPGIVEALGDRSAAPE